MKPKSSLSLSIGLTVVIIIGAACADDANETPDGYITQISGLEVRDELAIRQVMARMNHAIDTQAWGDYATFFTDDGVLDSFAGVSQGHDAIVAYLEAQAPFISTKRHVSTNIVINGDADRATAVSYMLVYERDTALRLDGTALITDDLVKDTDGQWRVTRHHTALDPATMDLITGGN